MQQWNKVDKSNKPGFTLIELMVVLALSVIVVTMVGSHVTTLDRVMVRSELEKLHTTCLYLQRRAMIEGREQELVIECDGQQYTHGKSVYVLPTQVNFSVLPYIYGPPSNPTQAPTTPVTFAANTIRFQPNGQIKPGTIYLADAGRQSQYALSCGVGGAACVNGYRYDAKWHLLF